MKIKFVSIAVLAGLLGTPACLVPTRHGPRIVVPSGHACVGSCDHYTDGGQWYAVAGHSHGPQCGHSLGNGSWKVKGRGR